jgi:hypothetical protein
MPEKELSIKILTYVYQLSLGYTMYRVTRGITWTADKVTHRWKDPQTPADHSVKVTT